MRAVRAALRDGGLVASRNLVRLRRVPDLVVFTVVQPVVFVLLFTGVFGGSIQVSGGDYREYLFAGILVQSGMWGAALTTIGIVDDLRSGLVDRFRTLPMSPAAVLVGRTATDLTNTMISFAATTACGLAIGWRAGAGPASVVAAFALVLVFTYSFTWPAAAIGLWVRSPQVAQSVGTLWLLPAVFLSNVFVEPRTLPGWLQPVAEWNPVSAATTATRELLGTAPAGAPPGPGPGAVALTLLWAAALLALFVPLAVWRFRRPPTR